MVIQTATKPQITWEPLPADYVLPDDPVENEQQPLLAAALTDALVSANLIPPNALMVSNFGLVATVNKQIVVKAPDWLYAPHVYPTDQGVIRRSYTPYREGGAVSIVMEFLSDTDGGEFSVRSTPPYGKLYFYEQILQVPVYVTYDPYAQNLEVRILQGDRYVIQTKNEHGRVWIAELNLFLGVWAGTRLLTTTIWLRWWDKDGNLLLWSAEKAEQENQRAESEYQRAEGEYQRAERESQRVETLAAKLRELGIDPDV